MKTPKIPENEKERLKSLYNTGLLDTQPEERFDRLTRLAKNIFQVPVALITFVDADRQWFKSRQGVDIEETSRDISFCGLTIFSSEIFHVEDASSHPDFSDNPLVTGDTDIHFYAGAPLNTADGQRIGTLCIIDTVPRAFNETEKKILRNLADLVEQEINQVDLHIRERDLAKARKLNITITRAQKQFITETDRQKAFDGLLKDILDITESEYGFIGEVLYTPENIPYLKTYAVTNISWNEETRAFYEANAPKGMEFTNLKSLFGAALTTEKPVIANDPYNDPRRCGIPEGHPPLNAFLGVPVEFDNKMVAMMGIANRQGGYDEELLSFLEPVFVTIGQLVTAFRNQEQLRESEEKYRDLFELSEDPVADCSR